MVITLETNVEFASEMLPKALRGYECRYDGLSFGDFGLFKLTPEKPNTARTLVPVSYKGKSAGDMFAILFRPGDGTGDSSRFQPWELNILGEYRKHPERVLPRDKTGIDYELFFPFFSVGKKVCWYAVSLEELTVDNVKHPNVVVKERDLGFKADRYVKILSVRDAVMPMISITTGYGNDGERFCDPHAVYFRVKADVIQVVGFLPIKNAENPLFKFAARLAKS